MINYMHLGNRTIAFFETNGASTTVYWMDSIYRKVNKEIKKLPYISDGDTDIIMNYIHKLVRNRKDCLFGYSNCHPQDEYNEELGEETAKKRLLERYFKLQNLALKHILGK